MQHSLEFKRSYGSAPSIENYALIGDCETADLVSRTGSIDWLCFPRFDSAACFAALLGTPENGRWRIAPTAPDVRIRRRYREGTLILETDFETSEGAATLIDFMPPRDGAADLVRLVVGRRGRMTFDVDFVARFDHGRIIPWVTRLDDRTLTAVAGPHLLVLQTPIVLHGKDMHTVGSFTIAAGERTSFTLTYLSSNREPPPHKDLEAALKNTQAFWTAFSGRCPQVGPCSADVKRSLITLKALTYLPSGVSSPLRPRRCQSKSEDRATGIIVSVGCAMRR